MNQKGQTALEYMLVSVIALIVVIAILTFQQGSTKQISQQAISSKSCISCQTSPEKCTPGELYECDLDPNDAGICESGDTKTIIHSGEEIILNCDGDSGNWEVPMP